MKELFKGKVVLITGGIGSIGIELLKEISKYDPKQVRVFDNRETELFYARQEYFDEKGVYRFLYGDVREKSRLAKAMQDVDIVYHAAAMKHVHLCEYDPFEAVKTNVLGTQNVIEAAIEKNVDRVILISTDKAVNPYNVMGTTKLLAERLVSSTFYNKGKSKTKFGAVRFGNVLASRGSVIEIWQKQIENNEAITITEPEMTRFFMTIPESVKLIFEATKLAENGEVFIFKMDAVKIKTLAEAMLELNKKPEDSIKVIGKRHGEKMHEELVFESEEDSLVENDLLYARLPLLDEEGEITLKSFLDKGFKKANLSKFTSDNEEILLDKSKVREKLASLE